MVMCLALALLVAPANAIYNQTDQAPAAQSGDVVIYPLFDVRSAENFQFFYLTNTSDYWVQAHVRVRSYYNSVEVLDFDIILSPHDVWHFFVLPDVGDGKPGMYSDDANTLAYSAAFLGENYNSTTGAWSKEFLTGRFAEFTNYDALPADLLQWGYIEVIAEGAITDGFMWPITEEAPLYASLLEAAQAANAADIGILGTTGIDIGDAPNCLMGHTWHLNYIYLTGYGSNAFALGSFRVPAAFTSTCTALGDYLDRCYRGKNDNWVTADASPLMSGVAGLILHEPIWTDVRAKCAFYYPDFATTYGPTLAFGLDNDGDADGIWDIWGSVDEVEQALDGELLFDNTIRFSGIFCSLCGFSTTYGVLTFPTMHFHFNTALLFDRDDTTDYTTGGKCYDDTDVTDRTIHYDDIALVCPSVSFDWTCYDVEENLQAGPGQYSPGEPPPSIDEVNVLAIEIGGDLDTREAEVGWFYMENITLGIDADRDGILEAVSSISNPDDDIDNETSIPPIGYEFTEHVLKGAARHDWTLLED